MRKNGVGKLHFFIFFKKTIDKLLNLWYNKDNEREVITMTNVVIIKLLKFELEHKYTKIKKTVYGENVIDAFNTNGLVLDAWDTINIEGV